MQEYTRVLRKPLDSISWDDDNFVEELLQVAQLFRPFSAAMDEFISEHGYAGDPADTDAKVQFIRSAFEREQMVPPREIREWFTQNQPVRRETVFQICFAFHLDSAETDEFFRRYYARERSFNCHQVLEAIYYFCLLNGLSYARAQEIYEKVPKAGKGGAGSEVVYTASIIAELNGLASEEELVEYLSRNIDKFGVDNVTAYETIRRLWERTAGPDGLLIQERQSLSSILDDRATGRQYVLRAGENGVRLWEAYLAIFQLDRKEVQQLDTDRSIRPILDRLHAQAQDSFPDRQGIDRILRGEHVSYERVRKWLVLLAFYTFWARKAVAAGNYAAESGDADRCLTRMNQYLMDAGYPEMYVGNPYDWIFFYAAKSAEPLFMFRYFWNELLTVTLEEHR